jgi:hypothetical protein
MTQFPQEHSPPKLFWGVALSYNYNFLPYSAPSCSAVLPLSCTAHVLHRPACPAMSRTVLLSPASFSTGLNCPSLNRPAMSCTVSCTVLHCPLPRASPCNVLHCHALCFIEPSCNALQISLDLCISEKELAKTRSQISFIYFQSHS